jgi:AcrR family transcriptional regulator
MIEAEVDPGLSRRDRKKIRTRGEIYDAAMRLFSKVGFTAATISDICEEADVGRGTFFLHFPSKASLLGEFNERVAESFRASLTEPRGSAREELRALVDRMSTELVAQAEIMNAMLSDFFNSPEAMSAASVQGDALAELVTDIIRLGQERGELSAGIDARLAAASFFATAATIMSGKVFAEGELTADEINRQFLQITFSGLSRDADSGS